MRLIDADAYSAEMKDRQDAAWKWRNEAIAEEDELKLARAEGAFTAFTEAKLTMDKHIISPWHRVEERLPPMLYQAEGDDFCVDYSLIVLAYREASHDFYLARQMDDGHGATWGTDCFDELYGVTHWMPLPEPPKEDADGNT